MIENEIVDDRIKILNEMNEQNYNNYCETLKENMRLKENIKDLLSSLALRRRNDKTRKRRYKQRTHKQRIKAEKYENIVAAIVEILNHTNGGQISQEVTDWSNMLLGKIEELKVKK